MVPFGDMGDPGELGRDSMYEAGRALFFGMGNSGGSVGLARVPCGLMLIRDTVTACTFVGTATVCTFVVVESGACGCKSRSD